MKPIWKWSFGEPQEKSPLIAKPTKNAPPPSDDEIVPPPAEYCREGGLRSVSVTAAGKPLTPQEELYDRINHREKIVQIGQNPFHQTNYVQDIEIQDRFLRGKLSGGTSDATAEK